MAYYKPYCLECKVCKKVFPSLDRIDPPDDWFNETHDECQCGGGLLVVSCQAEMTPPVPTSRWEPADWDRWNEEQQRRADRLTDCIALMEELAKHYPGETIS